jgi:hypothetical protein
MGLAIFIWAAAAQLAAEPTFREEQNLRRRPSLFRHQSKTNAMPVLLLLKGQPGSGKSTLAVALARRLRWPIVSKDAGRDPLQDASQRAPSQFNWNSLSYDIMWSFCEAQLEAGLDVIVDSPLARRELFSVAEGLAARVCEGDDAHIVCICVRPVLQPHSSCSASPSASSPTQHDANLALVECVIGDDGMWRHRLEQRGRQDAGTQREHKPGSWAAAQHVIQRNAGSEAWSRDVTLPCRVEVDTTTGTAAAHAEVVLQALVAAGLLSGLDCRSDKMS